MTIDDQKVQKNEPQGPGGPRRRHGRKFRRLAIGLFGVVLVVVGFAGGAIATAVFRHDEASLVLQPKAISSLADDGSSVAIRGKVAEVFGNKLIVADESGRALVETGPRGAERTLAAPGETITVQGRFDDGFLRASMLLGENGRAVDLKPSHPPFGPLKDQIARLAGR